MSAGEFVTPEGDSTLFKPVLCWQEMAFLKKGILVPEGHVNGQGVPGVRSYLPVLIDIRGKDSGPEDELVPMVGMVSCPTCGGGDPLGKSEQNPTLLFLFRGEQLFSDGVEVAEVVSDIGRSLFCRHPRSADPPGGALHIESVQSLRGNDAPTFLHQGFEAPKKEGRMLGVSVKGDQDPVAGSGLRAPKKNPCGLAHLQFEAAGFIPIYHEMYSGVSSQAGSQMESSTSAASPSRMMVNWKCR